MRAQRGLPGEECSHWLVACTGGRIGWCSRLSVVKNGKTGVYAMVSKKVGFSRVAPALALGLSMFACGQASAGVSGTVDVSLVVSANGCEVGVDNGTFTSVSAAAGSTMNAFGTLDFGQVKGGNWNYALSANVLGQASGQTGQLVVKCDLATGTTASFAVTVDGGKYSSGGQRYLVLNGMNNPLDTQRIPYGVYQNTARSTPYVPGTPGSSVDAPNGVSVPVPVYGAIAPHPAPNAAKEIPPAGQTYQDTLVVSIDFTIN